MATPDREQFLALSATTEPPASLAQRFAALAFAFNLGGDPNPLHSLGAQSLLDAVTAALLVLGLSLAVVHWQSQRGGILVLWLLGILSIAALSTHASQPDTFAAFHAVTPVLLLAASAMLAVCGQLQDSMRTVPRWRLDLLLLLLGAVIAINAHTVYVRRPADVATWTAFGSAETMAAQQISKLLPTSTIYLADVWLDDPTIRFLTPGLREPRPIDGSATLPLRQDETFAYFAPGRQEVVAEDLERVYEDGEIDRFRSPLDDTQVVLRTFRASSKVVAGTRGVTLRITSPDRLRTNRLTLPEFAVNWPIQGEASRGATLELFTALAVDTAGSYRFRLDGPPGTTLEINGAPLGRAGEEIVAALAGGTQRVRVAATTDGDSKIGLRWQPPGTSELTAIPPDRLYREQRAASGLLAAYRPRADSTSQAAVLRFERYVQREGNQPPVPRPYTLDLTGTLDAAKAGTYRFRLTGSGPVQMWLDDQPVPLGARPTDEPASIVLTEGDHKIRLRLTDEIGPTSFNLTWAPPGEDWGAIPTSRFNPPSGPWMPWQRSTPGRTQRFPPSELRAYSGSPRLTASHAPSLWAGTAPSTSPTPPLVRPSALARPSPRRRPCPAPAQACPPMSKSAPMDRSGCWTPSTVSCGDWILPAALPPTLAGATWACTDHEDLRWILAVQFWSQTPAAAELCVLRKTVR